MIERVLTIGVYGKTESQFFDALKNADIDTFCDIRKRRGVRGSQYAFVNSTKLQSRLAAATLTTAMFRNSLPQSEYVNFSTKPTKRKGARSEPVRNLARRLRAITCKRSWPLLTRLVSKSASALQSELRCSALREHQALATARS